MTTNFARIAFAAAVLLTGVSAASARPASQGVYDNAIQRSQIDLNSPEGAKIFWESTQRGR